jgi:NAD(P)-dependent dehydrogenase (short-subunit alcohol dehydrogenase family)
MKDLSGKYAVVTGAQKGIGYAIAKRFLAENVEGIALLDIDSIDTFTLDPAGTRAFSYICDVSDCENVKEVFEQIYFRFGRIDILVNNAGIIADAMFHKMTEVQWKERVFVTDMDRYGKYSAKIYETVDLEDAPSRIEARLSLIKEADESFPDSGHAIKWCFKQD